MKPYYQDDSVTIFHGDCRELLPQLDAVDVVVADPPYGISLPTNYGERGRSALAACHDYLPVHDDDKPFDPSHLLALDCPLVLWGANHYADKLPAVSGWLVWEKLRPDGVDQADCELAWTNFVKGARTFQHRWHGMFRDSERGQGYHPTQKPVALYEWTYGLRWFPAGVVVDPYAGSGPALVAAKRLGRRAVGIELEEHYCEVAARRCGSTEKADPADEPLLALMNSEVSP